MKMTGPMTARKKDEDTEDTDSSKDEEDNDDIRLIPGVGAENKGVEDVGDNDEDNGSIQTPGVGAASGNDENEGQESIFGIMSLQK